jgi:hypothetical protein
MTTRYDLISPRKRGDKTYWTRVGAGFPRDAGGFSLEFDALPLPDHEGKVRVLMTLPREDGQAPAPRQQQPAQGYRQPPRRDEMDDEIPF